MLGVERQPEKALFTAEQHPIRDVERDHGIPAIDEAHGPADRRRTGGRETR